MCVGAGVCWFDFYLERASKYQALVLLEKKEKFPALDLTLDERNVRDCRLGSVGWNQAVC